MSTTYNLSFVQMDIVDAAIGVIPGCLGWLQYTAIDSNPAGGSASIEYYFYKDIPHFLTGTNPVKIITDSLSGAEVQAIASSIPTAGLSLAAYLLSAYFAAAQSHKTIQTGVDAQSNPILVSAFAGASVVSVPVTVG